MKKKKKRVDKKQNNTFSDLTKINFFGKPLDKQAEEMGFSEENVMILKGDFGLWFKHKYAEVYENLKSCCDKNKAGNADKRSPEEFGKDLVAAWLVEDYFLDLLNKNNADFRVELQGGDRERKILPRKLVSVKSDFLVTFSDGTKRHLELVNNYTDFWKETRTLHLRENKYPQLEEKKSLLLAVAMKDKEFFLYDFSKKTDENAAKYLSKHSDWDKPAYELKIFPEKMMKCTAENLHRAILATKETDSSM